MQIAVVLCTYNGERFLHEQLASILAQSRRPDAMLAHDDGSSDRTISILKSYAVKAAFPVEIVVNRTNLGFARNFEKAIERAGADIIALSDQDDYWRPDKLQKIEQAFAADHDFTALFSEAEIVDEVLAPLGYGLMHALHITPLELARVRDRDFFPVLLRRNLAAGATMAFRANLKARVLPIPEGVYHDEWIALIAAAFNQLRYCPEPLIQYRQHGSNQLGARRWTITDRLRSIYRGNPPEEIRRLKVIENLHERLRYIGASSAVLKEVDDKHKHLRVRTSLPVRKLARALPIFREFLSGRYSRYSSGWRGAIRDLISS
jgi:glycosyltransferase involved in cell wall biosynthesis